MEYIYYLYCVLRGGTVKKSVLAVDEKQDTSLLWPYGVVCAIMQEARKQNVQHRGLTDEGRHILLSLHKQVHDNSGITACVLYRARLTACEVSILESYDFKTMPLFFCLCG